MTRHPGLETSDFLRACRGLPVERTPVWFMRQAGRSLPEYRRVREGIAMLDACRRPELVTEITLQPVRRYGVDAAIFFSDIVVPLAAAGVDLDILPGVGPVIAEPVRTAADLDRLPRADPDEVPLRHARRCGCCVAELGATPLIGFAGAPFTLRQLPRGGRAEPGPARTKALMLGDPALWQRCWTGSPSSPARSSGPGRRRASRGPAVRLLGGRAVARATTPSPCCRSPPRVLEPLAALGVPRIHFGVGAGELLALMAAPARTSSASTGGCRWTRRRAGSARPRRAGQPRPGRALRAAAASRHGSSASSPRAGAPGHVFNLGHGVLPGDRPGRAGLVVELVHEVAPVNAG